MIKSRQKREGEFWNRAAENINRDEFRRQRCTAAEREAAMDKFLGMTLAVRGETQDSD